MKCIVLVSTSFASAFLERLICGPFFLIRNCNNQRHFQLSSKLCKLDLSQICCMVLTFKLNKRPHCSFL
jgi:hypothetical protein